MFSNAEPGALNELASKMKRKMWQKDEYIIKCGEKGDGMFFLVYGDVNIISEVRKKSHKVWPFL
jgi:CRP-like cAMP-binding protein